jgi:hypothetical protein
MLERADYQPLDHPTIRTRWTRIIAIGFATLLILLTTQDMGWDVFRTIRVLGTTVHGFDEALAKVKLWPRWDVD